MALPDLMLMMAMGLIGAVGHLLLLKAYELAPVSVLSPLGYAEIIGAALIGYLFFGDLPDPWTWIGVAIIIAAGISISLPPRRQPGVAD